MLLDFHAVGVERVIPVTEVRNYHLLNSITVIYYFCMLCIGDFYVFPYDMRHCVYPFNGTKEKRRTLVCNCDVDYNPVTSRTAAGQLE